MISEPVNQDCHSKRMAHSTTTNRLPYAPNCIVQQVWLTTADAGRWLELGYFLACLLVFKDMFVN